MTELYQTFIERLEILFGPFNERRKSFKKSSNSKIARELCYSDSQFSRLVNDSASEGEYERAIKNVNRVINEKDLQGQLDRLQSGSALNIATLASSHPWLLGGVGFVILILAALPFYLSEETLISDPIPDRDHMLSWIFETSAISPFTKLDGLPEDCNYPCYKYQGQWNLKGHYKIPFFRERNGFHYLAKEVNLYSRCNTENNTAGNMMEGYEYQKHEIWYDKRELQIDSFLVASDLTMTRESYQQLDFEKDPNFVKVAFVHTFFRNLFNVEETTVERSGSVIGRDVEFTSESDLLDELGSEDKVRDIKAEVNSIITNRLEDFSRPISCKKSKVANDNFHQVSENDEISFECQLTTANAPIKYVKTYILTDQFIENVCMTSF